MRNVSVSALGAYAPRLRITAEEFEDAWGHFDAAGIEEKAVPEADEDAVTMGVEAAQRALDAAGRSGADVAHLSFATTTPPMAEEDLAPRLVSTLGIPADVTTLSETGSTRTGAQALDAALAAGPWGDEVGLVIVSDCPKGEPDSDMEHAAGAGAAAVVLDSDGPGEVIDRATHVEAFPGTRFRPAGDSETTNLGVTQYERESFRSSLKGAMSGLEADTNDVDAAAVQSPDGKLPYRVADTLGVDAETVASAETVSTLGDTGAASVFLGAASAFAAGARRVLLAAYGSGAGASIFVVDGDVRTSISVAGDTNLTYAQYLRRRGDITSGEPAGGGAYVSVPSWQRTIPQRHQLIAGRCTNCGALNFPPSGACRDCTVRPDTFDRVELPGTGTVEAVTTISQGGAPPEFVEQQSRSGPFVSAVVALDGPEGNRTVSIPTQVLSSDTTSVSIGTPIETTVRRVYTQEDVIRYGFKAQQADERR